MPATSVHGASCIAVVGQMGVYYYRLNTARPPLNDQRVRRALAAPTETERYAFYQEMAAILDECPVIPIYYYNRIFALSPKVRGHHPTLLDNHRCKYIHLEP